MVDKNYIGGKYTKRDLHILFEDEKCEEIEDRDFWDILVENRIFKSRGDCKRNCKYPKEIPWGWAERIIGKLRHKICIWNPTE